MKNAGRIAVIGSSNTDMVVLTDKFPAPGETVMGKDFLMNAGGKGANQAVAAARLGATVAFIGKVGSDMFGQEAIRTLKNEGIDVTSVSTDSENASGIAQITIDGNGENCIVVVPGANNTLTENDIQNAAKLICDADIVLLQLEIPLATVVHAAKFACQKGKKVILNPAPATELPDDLFPNLYMVTPNETEIELLTGIRVTDQSTAKVAAEMMINKGVEVVIITMGTAGAYIHSANIQEHITAPKVQAVDTTAAGDCFNGALALALAESRDLTDAVQFANRAASIAVTRLGAQSSLPNKNELDD